MIYDPEWRDIGYGTYIKDVLDGEHFVLLYHNNALGYWQASYNDNLEIVIAFNQSDTRSISEMQALVDARLIELGHEIPSIVTWQKMCMLS